VCRPALLRVYEAHIRNSLKGDHSQVTAHHLELIQKSILQAVPLAARNVDASLLEYYTLALAF
jgi:hypothetical protein